MKRLVLFRVLLSLISLLASGCGSIGNPPCRKVSADEFMRAHTFKGIATDQFIGITQTGFANSRDRKPDKAFKSVWTMGFFHGWEVLWCPVDELPADFLDSAKEKPYRPADA